MEKMKALASDYLKQAHHTQEGITWNDALKNIPKALWEKYGPEGVMDRIQEFVFIWAPRFVDFGEKICGRSSKKPWRTNPSLIGRYSRKRKSSTRMNMDVNSNMPRL